MGALGATASAPHAFASAVRHCSRAVTGHLVKSSSSAIGTRSPAPTWSVFDRRISNNLPRLSAGSVCMSPQVSADSSLRRNPAHQPTSNRARSRYPAKSVDRLSKVVRIPSANNPGAVSCGLPCVLRIPVTVSATALVLQGFGKPATWCALLIVDKCLRKVATVSRSALSARYSLTVCGSAGSAV